jgi:hypothetical protein
MDIDNGLETVKIKRQGFQFDHLVPVLSKASQKVKISGSLDLDVEKNKGGNWKINLSRVLIDKPFSDKIEDVNVSLSLENKKINAVGSFNISHVDFPKSGMIYTIEIDPKEESKFKVM